MNTTVGKTKRAMQTIQGNLQEADVAPTSQCVNAASEAFTEFDIVMKKWDAIQKTIETVNKELTQGGQHTIDMY